MEQPADLKDEIDEDDFVVLGNCSDPDFLADEYNDYVDIADDMVPGFDNMVVGVLPKISRDIIGRSLGSDPASIVRSTPHEISGTDDNVLMRDCRPDGVHRTLEDGPDADNKILPSVSSTDEAKRTDCQTSDTEGKILPIVSSTDVVKGIECQTSDTECKILPIVSSTEEVKGTDCQTSDTEGKLLSSVSGTDEVNNTNNQTSDTEGKILPSDPSTDEVNKTNNQTSYTAGQVLPSVPSTDEVNRANNQTSDTEGKILPSDPSADVVNGAHCQTSDGESKILPSDPSTGVVNGAHCQKSDGESKILPNTSDMDDVNIAQDTTCVTETKIHAKDSNDTVPFQGKNADTEGVREYDSKFTSDTETLDDRLVYRHNGCKHESTYNATASIKTDKEPNGCLKVGSAPVPVSLAKQVDYPVSEAVEHDTEEQTLIEKDGILSSCGIKLKTYHDAIKIQLDEHEGQGLVGRCRYEVLYKEPTQSRWKYTEVSGTPLKGMILDVLPGTRYEILVIAARSPADSEAVSLYRTTRYISPPGQVHVYRQADGAEAVVTWTEPECMAPGVTPSSYHLRQITINPLSDDDGNIDEFVFPESDRSAKLFIDPAKSYVFQIRSVCTTKKDISRKREVQLSILKHVILRESNMVNKKGQPVFQVPLNQTYIDPHGLFSVLDFGCRVSEVTPIEKVVLLLGKSGSGKTTMINRLINYMLGVQWSDPYRFQIASDNTKDQTKSQTDTIRVYVLHARDGMSIPFTLTIIDTPGFGSTEGVAQDLQNDKNLNKFLCSGAVKHINAVVFVARACDDKLIPELRKTRALLGENLRDTLYPLFTFASVGQPLGLHAFRVANIPFRGYVNLNNCYIEEDDDCSEGEDDDCNRDHFFSKHFWAMSSKSCKTFMTHIADYPDTLLRDSNP